MERGEMRTIEMRLILVLAIGLAGCGDRTAAGSSPDATPFQRVINVEVQRLEPAGFEERVQLTGTVQANRDVIVSAEEAGVVREILTQEGASVAIGQALLRIDDSILRSQVREAAARAALAQEIWERRQRLFEEDQVGSELAYLEARYQAEQVSAMLATLNERLDRTVVRSPIDGILETRQVEVGTMVSPGMSVVRIVQIDPVKVTGGVPERYAADVRIGAEASVRFGVLPGEEYSGRIGYVGATVNPLNRTFEAELVLSNPGLVIKPEMVANIQILRGQISDALVVPQEAVLRVEDGFIAFVVRDDGEGAEIAESRTVVLGPAQQNRVVVEQGLAPGDRVVVLGQHLVAHGDQVRIVGTRAAPSVGEEW